MSLTNYITLGKSGLRVSPFCLGAMTFGDVWGWGSKAEDAKRIMDYYIDNGGNFIDTANIYTKGQSEQIIGEHIGRHSSKRERMVLATKFFCSMHPKDPNAGGAGYKAIMSQCEESLRRLKTDYIDLYWLHCFDKYTPIEETMRALDCLVTSGKVRYIGFSDVPAWAVTKAQMIAKFKSLVPLTAIQVEYSLLERTIEGELVPASLDLGLGIVPWSPLKSGILTGKYTRENRKDIDPDRGAFVTSALNDQTYDVIDELIKIAKDLNTTPAKVALAWAQNRPGISSTIIGARTMQQLTENLSALDLKLTDANMQKLNNLSKPKLNFPFDHINSAGIIGYGGTTINGDIYDIWDLAPTGDDEG